MGEILEKILGKLGSKGSQLRRRVKRILGKMNPLTDPICDHGYTLTGLLSLVEKSPDNYEFPIKEECACRKMYTALKKNEDACKEKYQR